MASHPGERARAMHARLMVDLAAIVGESHVISEEALLDPYCVDWTRRFHGPALCVVRPASTEEVSAIAKVCTAAGVPMLPQGGNTGLVGGSVPAGRDTSGGQLGELPVIVSMRRIAWVDPVDELSAQVSVGAGTTLGDVQRHARAAGLEYGVDLASRDSATIGGTVATNAGGIRVLAYGMTRLQVTGIEAVLPVEDDVQHWVASPAAAVGFLLHAGSMDTSVLGARRALTMPGLSVTVAGMIEALERVAGPEVVKLIRRERDPQIEKIVEGWPRDFNAERAVSVGFKADADFDSIIRAHIAGEKAGG